MKSILILLALPTFLTAIYSCGTNDSKHTENSVSKLDFQIIKTGELHGAGEEGLSQEAIGVSNIEEFNELRNKINSVNEEIQDDIIAGDRFFEEKMLVFVFDRVRGTGGYYFKVKHVVLQNDTVTLTAFSKKPEEPATSIMTQPFQVLTLDRTYKEIKLEIIE